ncbi:MAG: carboxypeptidase regulatory-like domain-containing protein, partial [Bacteroidota bacterium]|nr:carboxypeptidase regulatory-like domain-containing protein [Bacteroidota bacterium]
MHREILSLFVCLNIVFAGIGQNGTISGTVSDTEGENLIQASLKLISDQDTLTTVTDLDGRYQFNAPVGEYTLSVSYLGMESEQRSFRLNMNENKFIDFTLSSSSTMIELTVVTGTTKDEEYGEQTVSIDILP